jgi:hypothetical protein
MWHNNSSNYGKVSLGLAKKVEECTPKNPASASTVAKKVKSTDFKGRKLLAVLSFYPQTKKAYALQSSCVKS